MLTCSSVRAAPVRIAHGEPADTDRDFAPVWHCAGAIRASSAESAVLAGGAQLARESERHVLLDRLDLFNVAEAVPGELVQHRGHQLLGHRGPARPADRGHAVE